MTAAGKRLSSKKQTTWTVSRGLPYLVSSREAKEALVGGMGGWEELPAALEGPTLGTS